MKYAKSMYLPDVNLIKAQDNEKMEEKKTKNFVFDNRDFKKQTTF